MAIGQITKLAKYVSKLINAVGIDGAGEIGYSRDTAYASGSTGVAMTGVPVSPWELADLLVDKPGINPAGWDWSPVFNAILTKYGYLAPGFGAYGFRSSLIIKPGYRIIGRGPGHAGGTAYSNIFATRLIALSGFVGTAAILGQIDAPENVLTAPQLEQFRLDMSQVPAHGIYLQSLYDGVRIDNVHVVNVEDSKYGGYIDGGAYGLSQTLAGSNCQFIRRPGSTSAIPVFYAEALNESVLTGWKFFGSSGGASAGTGAAAEFKGCSGIDLVGCSAGFAADGIAITDHPTRKTIGFTIQAPTFEALTRTALTVRGSPTRKANSVHLTSPRFYDSVFTMLNAIDVDNIESSDFECLYKKAVIGTGGDQVKVVIQRQNMVTNTGVDSLILSVPNAVEHNYGINAQIRALSGMLCEGPMIQRVAVFTAASGAINTSTRYVLVDRATLGTYSLPSAASFGAGFTMPLDVRSINTGSITLNAIGSDTIEGLASLNIAAGGKSKLINDGVSKWWVV